MATHVKVVGVLFIVFGVIAAFFALFSSLILGVLAGFVSHQDDPGAPLGATVLGLAGVVVTIALLAYAIPAIVCGIGLLKLRRWARILGIVLAAISLLRIPFGTLFGVYALIILFNKQTEALFGGGLEGRP
jgi:hypothetical protein